MEVDNNENQNLKSCNQTFVIQNIPGYSLEIMKAMCDSLSKLSDKPEEEKEVIFDNVLSLLSNLVKENFFRDLDNQILEERDIYLITTFSVKVIREISSTNGENLGPYLKEKLIGVIKIYLEQFIRMMNNVTIIPKNSSANFVKMLPVWEALVDLFSDSKPLHRPKTYTGCDEYPVKYLESIYDILNPSAEEWRRELKKEDMIDYLVLEKDSYSIEKIVYGGWTRAQIIEIDQNRMATIKLAGNGDVERVSLTSCLILPLGVLSKDYDLRENFQAGDLVDIYDVNGWYIGTISETRNKFRMGTEYKWVKFGLRLYTRIDTTSRTYVGTSEGFDREASVHSPRLKPAFTLTKKIEQFDAIHWYPRDILQSTEIESFLPFEIHGKRFYAVGKKTEAREIDNGYSNLINLFGDLGGFSSILSHLSIICSSTLLNNEYYNTLFTLYIDLVYNILFYLHFEFCKTFLDDLTSLAFKYLSLIYVETDNRNFKREKAEFILRKIKDILSKIYVDSDVNIKYDMFTIQFGIACLKSNMLDKKLIGLKIITDILNDVHRVGHYSRANPNSHGDSGVNEKITHGSSIMAILKNENFFDLIFGPNSHTQIFQKSEDLIKEMIFCKLFGEDELLKLWSIVHESTDLNLQLAIYKSLRENVYYLEYDNKKFFIKLIIDSNKSSMSLAQLTQELEVLQTLQRSLPSDESMQSYRDIGYFVFEFIFTSPSNEFQEGMINVFVSLLRGWDYKDLRSEYIESLLKKINERSTAMDLQGMIKYMKVLRIIVNALVGSIEDWQKNKIFFLIVDEYNTVSQLIEFLQVYHITNKNIVTDTLDKEQYSMLLNNHNELIKEFFAFCNWVIHNTWKLRLSMDQVKNLFSIFVENPITFKNRSKANDTNLLFKFLKDADEKRGLPDEAFENIFSSLNTSKDKDLEFEFDNVSFDLMKVLWTIFLSINKTNHKIHIQERGHAARPAVAASALGINLDNIVSITISEDKTPMDLDGFELIYRLLISSPVDVSSNLTGYFIQLFVLHDRMSCDRGSIHLKLIQKAFQSISDNLNDELSTANANKILNALGLLKALIEESERLGTAGVVPHSSISMTSAITLQINTYQLSIQNLQSRCFPITVFTKTTLWDLKRCLARKLSLIPEVIMIKTNDGKELPENCHGKTINDLKLKNDDILLIVRNPVIEAIPRSPLLEKGQLSERFVSFLTEVFYKFSTHKKLYGGENEDSKEYELCMSRDDLRKFTRIATGNMQEIEVHDPRIIRMFNKYDTDLDDLISLKDFFKFYQDSIEDKKETFVWENIKNLGGRNDFKKMTEPIEQFNSVKDYMPRWVISAHPEFFNILFNIQEKLSQSSIVKNSKFEALIKSCSTFMNIICTNPTIYRDILLLEKLNHEDDWGIYIEESKYYKQLYSLYIIESFFDEFEMGNVKVDTEPIEMNILEDSDLVMKNPKVNWIERFISEGGLNYLLKMFLKYDIDATSNAYLRKVCLSMLIKILRSSISIIHRASCTMNSYKDDILSMYRNETISNTNTNTQAKYLIRSQSTEAIQDSLLANLNSKFENRLVSQIFYGDLCNYRIISTKLINILWSIVNKNTEEDEERILVASVTNMFSLIFISLDNLNDMTTFLFDEGKGKLNFEDLIIKGILLHNDMTIRVNFYKLLKHLCKNLIQLGELSFVSKLLNLVQAKLFSLMSSSSSSSCSNKMEKENCKYLFNLLEKLIAYLMTGSENEAKTGNISLQFSQIAFSIYEILSVNENLIEDEMLCGYIKLLTILVKYDSALKLQLTTNKNLIHLLINQLTLKDIKYPQNCSLKNQEIQFELINVGDHVSTSTGIATEQSDDIRNNIFTLIISLVESSTVNLISLFQTKLSMVPLMFPSKKRMSLYNPSSEKRAPCGYVGIKNLGAICYMNSVLQQFFNIPSFRYAIMQINDGLGFTEHKDNTSYDDNILHQLQKMFVYLELSNRISYNPTEFCWAFKDSSGQRVNTAIQQDSQEFLTRFFSRMEASVEKTQFKYIMQSMFGGATCSQVICKDCGNANNNFEDFYNLSLEVKNMKSLNESLDKFISDEKIEGYKCSNCDKVTTVSKRNSLASLPNILIVHLQRIIFNYDTCLNEKVNSSLEFPKVLNLRSHCTEEITKKVVNSEKSNEYNDRVYEREENYYEYTLVGVVVHSGHADGGHYFSYINTSRNGVDNSWDNNNNNDTSKSAWLNFNDAFVSPFDITTLEANCFGGNNSTNSNTISQDADILQNDPAYSLLPPAAGVNNMITQGPSDDNWDQANGFRDNVEFGQSAYMLIYERKIKTPIKIIKPHFDLTDNINNNNNILCINEHNKYKILKELDVFNKEKSMAQQIESKIIYDEEKKEYFEYLPFYAIPKRIPNVYYMEVMNDNIEFYNDQKIFNPNFNEFLNKVVECFENVIKFDKLDNDQFNYIFQVILKFLLNVIPKSSSKQCIKEIMEKINRIQLANPSGSITILNAILEKHETLQDILFSNDETANSGYKQLIKSAIMKNIEEDKQNGWDYVTSISGSGNEMMIIEKKSNPLPGLVLLEAMIDLFPVQLTRSWTKMLSFLEILAELCKLRDPLLIEFFNRKDLMARCIDFFLQNYSPYYSKNDNRQEMGKSGAVPKFSPLFSIISVLISHYSTEAWDEAKYMQNPFKRPHTFVNILDFESQDQMSVDNRAASTGIPNIKAYVMTEMDKKLLNTFKFYQLAVKENYNNREVGSILSHMMFNNYEFSKQAMFLAMEVLNNGSGLKDAKDACELLSEMMRVEDDYSHTRMEWVFGIPYPFINFSACETTLPYRPQQGRISDPLFMYRSYLTLVSCYESLADRIVGKYSCSSEFILILTTLFTEVLFKSEVAFMYFDSLPHPKPLYRQSPNSKLIAYVGELVEERLSSPFSNNEGAVALWKLTMTQYNNYMSLYQQKYSSHPELDFHLSNINYRPISIVSDVFYLCDHLQGNTAQELKAKDVYLYTVDYEFEYKPASMLNDNLENYTKYIFYEPEDGIINADSYGKNWSEIREEPSFKHYASQEPIKRRRQFTTTVAEDSKVAILMRKYTLVNYSTLDYKFRVRFIADDITTLNTHIPKTETANIIKPNMKQYVHYLYKEDYSKDFGKYHISIDLIVLKPNCQSLKIGTVQDPNFSILQLEENEIIKAEGNAEKANEEIQVENCIEEPSVPEGFQLDCMQCGKSNIFTTESDYMCKFCHRPALV